MSVTLLQIDAFTDRPFAGNPAAVCLGLEDRPELWDARWMQSVANEMNLSETAFVRRRHGGGASAPEFDLRWFTPAVEVDLCGHATLASAHALATTGAVAPGMDIRFHTRSGPLMATLEDEGSITLDFPAFPPAGAPASEALTAALGAAPREVMRARDVIAIYERAEDVRGLKPDMSALAALDTFAVIATALGTGPDGDVDFVSRFFAPAKGVPEDPVTGSAHCALTPLWGSRLGRPRLTARQVSARSGEMACELAGDRVRMTGRAVLVFTGELCV